MSGLSEWTILDHFGLGPGAASGPGRSAVARHFASSTPKSTTLFITIWACSAAATAALPSPRNTSQGQGFAGRIGLSCFGRPVT